MANKICIWLLFDHWTCRWPCECINPLVSMQYMSVKNIIDFETQGAVVWPDTIWQKHDSESIFLLCFIPSICRVLVVKFSWPDCKPKFNLWNCYVCLMFRHQQIGLAAFLSTTILSRLRPWWTLGTDTFSISIIYNIVEWSSILKLDLYDINNLQIN